MNNEKDLHYIETDEIESVNTAEEPKTKGILSLVFGILSIVLNGIIGIVLGALARKFAAPILIDFEKTVSAKLARAGKITGTIGILISIVSIVVAIILVVLVVLIVFALSRSLVDAPVLQL